MRTCLSLSIAAIMLFGLFAIDVQPASAFSERQFKQVIAKNDRFMMRALARWTADPNNKWRVKREISEIGRAARRDVLWLDAHRATSCQKRPANRLRQHLYQVTLWTETAARAVINGNWDKANKAARQIGLWLRSSRRWYKVVLRC